MDRRTFLTTAAAAAAVAPFVPARETPAVIGVDWGAKPSATAYRLLSIQNGVILEIHRVTGISRYYQMGRDTWQDQVDAGTSELVETIRVKPGARCNGG